MSRHSKNNTAGAVFTYKEKQMLKGIYGTKTKILETESMKKFEQCFICLQKLEEPFCCSQGHLFCKECIMNNLLQQKKKIKRIKKELNLKLKADSEEKRQLEQLNKELEMQIKRNRNDDFALRQSVKNANNSLNDALKTDERGKLKLKEKLLKDQIQRKVVFDYDNKLQKKKLAQTSFWMSGTGEDKMSVEEEMANSGDREKGLKMAIEQKLKEDNQRQAKSRKEKLQLKMICPGDNVHKIRVKDLIKVSLKTSDKSFVCKYCEKLLNFQKICCLKLCGHVYCVKCLKEMPGQRCLCGQKIQGKKIVHLKESKSGFGSHNKTEIRVYTRAYLG